jgi:hypothetical protein
MKPAKLKLKERKLGKGLGWRFKLGWYWLYYSTAQQHGKKAKVETQWEKEDEKAGNFLTVQSKWRPTLIAVIPKQLKGWNKQGIVFRHHWSWANKWMARLEKRT